MHLALVHEFEQRRHIGRRCAIKDNEQVLVQRRRLEEISEMFAARGEDKLVSPEGDAIAEQRHVRERFALEQIAERRR